MLAGIVIQEREEEHGPPTGKPIQIQLASRFPELIEPALAKVREKLESFPGQHRIQNKTVVGQRSATRFRHPGCLPG